MTPTNSDLPPPELLAYLTPKRTSTTPPIDREALSASLAASPFAWDRVRADKGVSDVVGLLEAQGWVVDHYRGDAAYMRRPGKDEGHSATVGEVGPDVLNVFTSSMEPQFEAERAYDYPQIYAAIHYGGDYAATDKALVAQYGGERKYLSDQETTEGLEQFAEKGRQAEAMALEAAIDAEVDEIDALTYTVADLQELPDLEWLADNWITDEAFTVIYGKPKTGKSFLAVDLSMRLATRTSAWLDGSNLKATSPTGQPHKVGYLVGEGMIGYKARINAWMTANPSAGEPEVFFVKGSGLSIIEKQQAISRWAIRRGLTVLIVDTLNRFSGGMDENDTKEMSQFVQACDYVRFSAELALIVVHHEGKDASAGLRGSSVLFGALDVGIHVTAPTDTTVSVKLAHAKDAEQGRTMHLEYATAPGQTSPVLQPASTVVEPLGDTEKDTLKVMRSLGQQRTDITVEEIAAHKGAQEKTVRNHLTSLRSKKMIEATGDGTNKVTTIGWAARF